MTLGVRKLIVAGTVVAVLLLANTLAIAQWLDHVGVLGWARHVRSEYLSGSALTTLLALLILIAPPAALVRQCRTCRHLLLKGGRYCPRCGTKL